jgi:hypothetical protein
MKVFLIGVLFGFIGALYFSHVKGEKKSETGVTETFFPLKPDYGEDRDKDNKEK